MTNTEVIADDRSLGRLVAFFLRVTTIDLFGEEGDNEGSASISVLHSAHEAGNWSISCVAFAECLRRVQVI